VRANRAATLCREPPCSAPDVVVACAERATKRAAKTMVKAAKVAFTQAFSKNLDSIMSGVRIAKGPAADGADDAAGA
jgi:hypothetical protein